MTIWPAFVVIWKGGSERVLSHVLRSDELEKFEWEVIWIETAWIRQEGFLTSSQWLLPRGTFKTVSWMIFFAPSFAGNREDVGAAHSMISPVCLYVSLTRFGRVTNFKYPVSPRSILLPLCRRVVLHWKRSSLPPAWLSDFLIRPGGIIASSFMAREVSKRLWVFRRSHW